MNSLRRDLNLQNIPFILGGLGDFLPECSPSYKNYHYVNKTLRKIASENDMTGFAGAEGLGANPDNLHFNAAALREFGIRYYKEFSKFYSRIEFKEIETENEERTEIDAL